MALKKTVQPIDFLLHQVPRLAEAGYTVYRRGGADLGARQPQPADDLVQRQQRDRLVRAARRGDLRRSRGAAPHPARGPEARRGPRAAGRRQLRPVAGGVAEEVRDPGRGGHAGGGSPRFRRTQVGLLDVLLAEQPEARFDERFERRRERLRQFQGIAPADPPAGFQGQLRGYQRDGLGWLHFLREFGFGGCLADDMGLGKTVQVLALLEVRELRAAPRKRRRPPPSLVVVPRSLVFNWKQEAARFTPKLRVPVHADLGREARGASSTTATSS